MNFTKVRSEDFSPHPNQRTKDRELNNLHIFVGWAGEPVFSGRAGRPSHNNNKNCKLFNSHS